MKFSNKFKSVVAAICLVLFAGIGTTNAVPSYPNPVKIRQVDGTTITVRLYGDEKFNYATSTDGYQLVANNGIYYYAQMNGTQLVSTGVKAKDPLKRGAEDSRILRTVHRGVPYAAAAAAQTRAMSESVLYGGGISEDNAAYAQTMAQARSNGEQFRSLVILVEFSDRSFSVSNPQNAFDRMLNQEGYSENQATGSARDYYVDNSNGKFNPHFDVVGPFVMSQTSTYYPGHEVDFVIEACDLAEKNGVDFSQYVDDGRIRDVFVFFAGYNNAEVGGGTYIHPARISDIYGNPLVNKSWGGGQLYAAAYSSELKGASGVDMAGIGTFCHEFGHILGWPDFYDTDYEQNGSGFNLDIFSLMSSGAYVNDGRTPPALNAYERYLANWTDLAEITTPGKYMLEPVYNDKCYIIKTLNSDELFLFEYRNGTINKWDRFLADGNSSPNTGFPAYGNGSGMLIYHIDRSQNRVGRYRAADLWKYNGVNAIADHECMKIVMAAEIRRNGVLRDFGKMFFPGKNNVTQFTSTTTPLFVGWDGFTTGLELYDIKENGTDNVSFEVRKVVNGGIKDVKVTVGQANIGISFVSPFNDKYVIKCQEVGGTATSTKNTTERAVNFDGLKPGTKYLITVAYEGEDTVLDSREVSTLKADPDKVPSLIVSGLYSVHDYVILGFRNIQSEVKSVAWTIDGSTVSSEAVKLPAKSGYKVMAKITTTDGVEYLVKYVNVN